MENEQSIPISQNHSEAFMSYALKEGKPFFQNYSQQIFKKKLKKRTLPKADSNTLNPQKYSVFNLIKLQKPPKLGYGLLARQIQTNFIKRKTAQQIKEQHQLSLYKDYQKTMALKTKYVRYTLNQISKVSSPQIKQAQSSQTQKLKTQIQDLILEDVQKRLPIKQIPQKKIKTTVRQVDLLNLKFLCFSSFLLNRSDNDQFFSQLEQWKLNIKRTSFQPLLDAKIKDNEQNMRDSQLNYIKCLLLNSIPFQTYSNANLKIVKQWQTNFIHKEQHQIIKKRITGKMLYTIQQKGRNIAEQKLKLSHFRKAKKLNLGCLKNNFCKGLFKNRQNSNISLFDSRNRRMHNYDPKPQNDQQTHNKQLNKKSSENRIRNSHHLNNFIQKIQTKQHKRAQKSQQFCINHKKASNLNLFQNNLLHHIKNRSKKSPIAIAALDQSTYSKNAKFNNISNKTNLKKNAFFYKPSSKNIDKQNIELLLKNNSIFLKNSKSKSSFYPIYVGQLKIQSSSQSYLEYQCQSEQIKTFTVKFLSDRIKSQQNNVVIIIPALLGRQIEEKLKKMIKIVVSLGGKLKLKQQDPYKLKNRRFELDLMIYQHLTKVSTIQIIKFLELQQKFNTEKR